MCEGSLMKFIRNPESDEDKIKRVMGEYNSLLKKIQSKKVPLTVKQTEQDKLIQLSNELNNLFLSLEGKKVGPEKARSQVFSTTGVLIHTCIAKGQPDLLILYYNQASELANAAAIRKEIARIIMEYTNEVAANGGKTVIEDGKVVIKYDENPPATESLISRQKDTALKVNYRLRLDNRVLEQFGDKSANLFV